MRNALYHCRVRAGLDLCVSRQYFEPTRLNPPLRESLVKQTAEVRAKETAEILGFYERICCRFLRPYAASKRKR